MVQQHYNVKFLLAIVNNTYEMATTNSPGIVTLLSNSEADTDNSADLVNNSDVVTGSALLTFTNKNFAFKQHPHGNITNDGRIGDVANRMIITTEEGVLNTMGTGINGQVIKLVSGVPTWSTDNNTWTDVSSTEKGIVPKTSGQGKFLMTAENGTATWAILPPATGVSYGAIKTGYTSTVINRSWD